MYVLISQLRIFFRTVSYISEWFASLMSASDCPRPFIFAGFTQGMGYNKCVPLDSLSVFDF